MHPKIIAMLSPWLSHHELSCSVVVVWRKYYFQFFFSMPQSALESWQFLISLTFFLNLYPHCGKDRRMMSSTLRNDGITWDRGWCDVYLPFKRRIRAGNTHKLIVLHCCCFLSVFTDKNQMKWKDFLFILKQWSHICFVLCWWKSI